MGLIFQWTSLVPVAEASGAVLILMGNVQMSYGHLAVVTILVLCSKPMSIVALMGLGVVGPQTFQGFFKDRCPTSYSYPQDDPTSLFTCPTGTNYSVVFCP